MGWQSYRLSSVSIRNCCAMKYLDNIADIDDVGLINSVPCITVCLALQGKVQINASTDACWSSTCRHDHCVKMPLHVCACAQLRASLVNMGDLEEVGACACVHMCMLRFSRSKCPLVNGCCGLQNTFTFTSIYCIYIEVHV